MEPTQKKATEHVLPLRDPGDGLHIDRMEPEEGGDEGALPKATRKPTQGEEKQNDGGRVQGEIHQVHGAGVQAEEADVRHEGKGGQRHPKAGVRLEGFTDAGPSEAVGDRRVFEDVAVVVVMDEIGLPDHAVCAEDGDDQRQDHQRGFARGAAAPHITQRRL